MGSQWVHNGLMKHLNFENENMYIIKYKVFNKILVGS